MDSSDDGWAAFFGILGLLLLWLTVVALYGLVGGIFLSGVGILLGIASMPIVIGVSLLALAVATAIVILAGVWVVTGGAYFTMFSLRGFESLSFAAQGIFMACPHCYTRFTLPIYSCPCGESYEHLQPSTYGILSHTCGKCQRKLPTLYFLGRSKLSKRCARCNRSIDVATFGQAQEFHYSIVGSRNSGKTMLLNAAVWLLEENFFPKHGLRLTFSDAAQHNAYRRQVSLLKRGERLGQTVEDAPSAFNLEITRSDGSPALVYLYDPAGESYTDLTRLVTQGFQRYVDGLLLVIDPFSLTSVRSEYRSDLVGPDVQQLSPSPSDPQEVVGQLLNALEEMPGGRAGQKMHTPMAVALTKADAHGLGDQIGAWKQDGVVSALTLLEAVAETARFNGNVRSSLVGWGYANLVSLLESRFESVRYFSCSATGRMPSNGDKRPFQPIGVVGPLVWLLAQRGVLVRTGTAKSILANLGHFVTQRRRG